MLASISTKPKKIEYRIDDPQHNLSIKDMFYLRDEVKECRAFLRLLESTFGLPDRVLYYRNTKTGRPLRVYNNVNLSELRTAAVAVIQKKRPGLPDRAIALALGTDRSCVVIFRQNADKHFSTGDPVFQYYYQKALACVENETVAKQFTK
ncbi:MAG: hypothetical protein EOP04_06960 [Proteobacteria bacterium]|nr:MAG: hypothetical protein EOP04_06960 [Pseudomonadota bacterium]